MTARLEIPARAFHKDSIPEGMDEILKTCLAKYRALTVYFEPDVVKIGAAPIEEKPARVKLRGGWRTSDCQDLTPTNVGVKLALPVLYDIKAVSFPSSEIMTMKSEGRSLNDFFATNLLFALCRNVAVSLDRTSAPANRSPDGVRRLRERYISLLHSMLSEKALGTRSASDDIDMMLINAYVPVMEFSTSLMEQGSLMIRQMVRDKEINNVQAQLHSQLLEVRKRLLACDPK